MRWGVIPIQYRQVDCGTQPNKRAEGASFPGEFPSIADAKAKGKDAAWYHQYFPDGGYLNSIKGDGSGKISVDEFMQKLGQAASPTSSSGRADSAAIPVDASSAESSPQPQFDAFAWIWG